METRPQRVVLKDDVVVRRIVELARSQKQAKLADNLLLQIRKNVRLQKQSELPEESSDEELVARVEALEKRAMELSLSLQRARSSYAPQLASRASEVCRAATEKAVTDCKVDTASFEAFSSGELKKTACLAISEHVATDRSTSAQPPSFSRTVVAGRIEKIKHKACDMRRKAQNVLDTLRIIAESESEATVNITVDGEVVTLHNTFAESGDQCDNCSDEFKRPSTSPTPLFCAALSPHVTPRTRTRSRLLAISPVAKIALPQ